MSKNRALIYFIRIILYLDERNTYDVKNVISICQSSGAVSFRNRIDIMNINAGTIEFCSPGRALVRFGERHVT